MRVFLATTLLRGRERTPQLKFAVVFSETAWIVGSDWNVQREAIGPFQYETWTLSYRLHFLPCVLLNVTLSRLDRAPKPALLWIPSVVVLLAFVSLSALLLQLGAR